LWERCGKSFLNSIVPKKSKNPLFIQQVQELFHYEAEVTKGFVMGVGMVSDLSVIGDEFPLFLT